MAYLLLAFLSALWGTSFLLIKIASDAFDPFSFALGRAGVGALALGSVALVARWPWPREPRVWGSLLTLSLLGQVTPLIITGTAARLTTSADLALMMGAAPIATMLIARLLGLGEVWNLTAAFGLALGLVGVSLALAAPVDPALYPHASLGRLLGLVAAVLYAVGALISRNASRRVGAAMTAVGSMAISSTTLAAIWLVVDGPGRAATLLHAPPASIAAIVALGCINTALGYLVYFRLVATSGATFAALNNYIVPFIGLALGASLLDEKVALASWGGLGLVIASVVLTGLAARRSVAVVKIHD